MDPALAQAVQGASESPSTDVLQPREIQIQRRLDPGRTEKFSLALPELEDKRYYRRENVATFQRTLSPIRRLPTEILAQIFMLCRNNSLKSSTYSIADPREAPILLGHITSHWRSICHGTPFLWDRVIYLTSDHSMPSFPCIQQIFARSGSVPLSVQLTPSNRASLRMAPKSLPNDPVIGLFLELHGRLKEITLTIPSSDLLPPHSLHQNQTFPILVALDIVLADPDGNPDVTSVLSVFTNAPSLRSVSLLSHCSPARSLVPALPWAQLTELELYMPIGLGEVRAILTQCRRLQSARFSSCAGPEDIEAPEGILQLANLQTLNLGIEDDNVPDLFFQAFSFPNLRDLVLHAQAFAPTIQTLYDRSRYQLETLVLTVYDLSSHDLLGFLGLLPTLRELDLYFSGIDDELFEAFTFNPSPSLHSLRLPHLEKLCLCEISDRFTSISAVRMAESLCVHSGRPNSAFPALKAVCLEFYGEEFEENIERRLIAAGSTGLISYGRVPNKE
ncbi:hypothetical protein B0H19DRAFT_57877 [Mycena capillaripes]|nr:hypothetical protein B0H19DRAFT_57877 [Mycena capillaripes]